MDSIDLAAIALMAFIVLALVGAFAAYARTAYKKGGWKRVRRDLLIAFGALTAFAIERIAENSFVDAFRK